jgi:hypothetical protein
MRLNKLAAGALCLLAMPATAATVIWQTPTTVATTGDLVQAGSLHAAMAVSGPVTVAGVGFGAYNSQPLLVKGVGLKLHPSVTGTADLADTDYNTLLSKTAYNEGNTPDALQIGGLTVGASYTLQIFQAFWFDNWATSYVAGNASGLVFNSGRSQGPLAPATLRPQFVVGSFIADSANQFISFTSPTADVLMAAVQVRQTAGPAGIPEPASWAMLITGFGLVGAAARRKRLSALAAPQ